MTGTHGNEWPATIHTPDGVARCLGLVPSHVYSAGILPPPPPPSGAIIPQSELFSFDVWPPTLPIMDQGEWNACTWFSGCQALLFARYENGQEYVQLDPLYAYLKTTGGRNTGTNILQSARSIRQNGIPPLGASSAPNVDAQAHRFRFALGESLESWVQIVSEVARRRPVVGSVCVGKAYMTLDAEGAMGVVAGQANHAIFLGGGLKFSQRHGWMCKHAGSWGTRWGLKGFGWYTEAHFDQSRFGESYTVQAVHEDLDPSTDIPPMVSL